MAAPVLHGPVGPNPDQHQNQITQDYSTTTEQDSIDDIMAAGYVARRERRRRRLLVGVPTAAALVAVTALLSPQAVRSLGIGSDPTPVTAAPERQAFGKTNQVELTGNRQAVAEDVIDNHFALTTQLFNRPTRDGYTADKIANDLQFLYDPAFLQTTGSPDIAGNTVGDEFTEQAKRFGGIITIADKGFWDHDLVVEGDMVGSASFGTSANGDPTFTARVQETAEFIPAGKKNPQEVIDRMTCLTFEQTGVVVPGVQGYYPDSWRMTGASSTC